LLNGFTTTSRSALSKMSFGIIQAVISRLERRLGPALLDEVNKSMKLIRSGADGYWLDVEELVERERPPMISLPEYRSAREGPSPP
jgi:glucosyl-3-phosphoglycerate synthase